MLYLYYGNDVPKVRAKAFTSLEALTQGEIIPTYVTCENYEEGIITDAVEGQSLFGGVQIIVIDTLSEDAALFEQVLTHVPHMAGSANHFIWIEGVLKAPEKKKIQAHASLAEEITGDTKAKFNTFSLTDALLRRDKKSLWILLMEAWQAGVSNEEIIGILFWQIKILRLASKTKSAEEAGQKPFIYNKAKSALRNFKAGDLERLGEGLLSIYHDGHAGKIDTALGLEKWVLTL